MINGITHRGNRHTRPLIAFNQLEHSVIAEHFGEDYPIGNEDQWTPRFFNYRGSWYDTHEFEVAPLEVKVLGYDGVQTESYFSAVVVSYFDRDGYELQDEIIVGYIHW